MRGPDSPDGDDHRYVGCAACAHRLWSSASPGDFWHGHPTAHTRCHGGSDHSRRSRPVADPHGGSAGGRLTGRQAGRNETSPRRATNQHPPVSTCRRADQRAGAGISASGDGRASGATSANGCPPNRAASRGPASGRANSHDRGYAAGRRTLRANRSADRSGDADAQPLATQTSACLQGALRPLPGPSGLRDFVFRQRTPSAVPLRT
jgi:hypothetical protein